MYARTISIRFAIALSAVAAAGIWHVPGALAQAQPKPPPAVVRVAPVAKKNVEVTKSFVATVMPLRKSVLGSAVDGRVTTLHVNEGDPVKAGQPVAQLLTKTIEAEVAVAEANWELRKQELAEMQNGTRKEDLDAAIAREDAAKAVAEYAATKFRRVEGLAKRGQANEGELEEAMSNAHQLQKLFAAAKAARDLAEAGPRPEQIAQAKAREAAAMHEVERLRDMQAKYTIRAPYDGYVTAESTEVGAWVNKGDPIVEVIELKQVDVMAMVPEGDVENVSLGLAASVRVDALPNAEFAGAVALVVPQADVRSRSMPVKIRVENQLVNGQPLLKAGMSARVSLRVNEPALALVVPKDALVIGGPEPLVYIVESQGGTSVVKAIPVKLGEAVGHVIAVTAKNGELKVGQSVVVEGNERRRDGEEVRVLAQKQTGG
ncbi:MAG: efflux RND transporter periplasmic adaptor subunit [Planctomycetota bacterium]|nr:MAG: efflux RND transporter periplasmic adaptor subunit [Planctomycetota bacterium]